jgi:hypothetical protein
MEFALKRFNGEEDKVGARAYLLSHTLQQS